MFSNVIPGGLSKASILAVSIAAAPFAMTGCGSSGGTTSVNGDNTNSTGTLSVAITDGPVDSATKVVVEFTGVSIKPVDGEAIEFTFESAKSIDLLQLQGSASDSLVSGATVNAGAYEWIRLHVNATQDSVLDSYLELNDGTQQELWIPSGGETGLKLVSGFTVPAGGSADFTIDFDLRKSLTNPPGMPSAILKPALRIVDNTSVGSISGTVSADIINAACADPAMDDGSVYVYAGETITPVDVQGTESDPLASALVNLDGDQYVYEVGFLPEGSYTVAYTCQAVNDDPTTADDIAFEQSATTAVVAEMATAYSFTVQATEDDAGTATEEETTGTEETSTDTTGTINE